MTIPLRSSEDAKIAALTKDRFWASDWGFGPSTTWKCSKAVRPSTGSRSSARTTSSTAGSRCTTSTVSARHYPMVMPRGLALHRELRSSRSGVPRGPETACRPGGACLGIGPPVLDRRRRTQPARPAAPAVHRGSDCARGGTGWSGAGLSRPTDSARECFELRDVHGFERSGVGVSLGGRATLRLPDSARCQQRVRKRSQPRIRPARIPRRRAARTGVADPSRRPQPQRSVESSTLTITRCRTPFGSCT